MKKMGVGLAALICLGVFIVFGILAAVTLNISGGISKFNWNNSNWFSLQNHSSYSIDQTLSFTNDEIANIKAVSISSVSADITVETGDTLTAHLYGDYHAAEEIELITNKSGGNLQIKVKLPVPSISNSNLKLDITIPQSYVEELSLSTVSGGISMEIPDQDFRKLSMSSTSGGLKCDIATSDVKANTVSGRVRCTIKEGDIDASSTSGSVHCTTSNGDIEASSVSGSLTLRSDQFDSIDARTTSGSINITVSKDSSFKVVFDSVSGSFNSVMPLGVTSNSKRHFEGTFGEGDSNIKGHSVSGSCQINYE